MNTYSHDTYRTLTLALQYAVDNYAKQPSLSRMASIAGMPDTEFHKLFSQWVGISPKRFVQVLTRDHALHLLKTGASSLHTSLSTGLSSPSRLQDLMLSTDGMTPKQIRQLGLGQTLYWACVPTALGYCYAACTAVTQATTQGQAQAQQYALSHLEFSAVNNAQADTAWQHKLQHTWPAATLEYAPQCVALIVDAVLHRHENVPVFLRGTGFQIQVWRALLNIPQGCITSYGAIAQALGRPKAYRAVGTAVGDNPISVLIPCHRVLQQTGGLGGYAWGLERKVALLGQELASRHTSITP